MSNARIILIEVIIFVILYWLLYYIARHGKLTGDAAGMGMERGYRVLLVMAIFFILAIGLSIVNYFLIRNVTDTGIKLAAFIPIVISGGHILYTILFK